MSNLNGCVLSLSECPLIVVSRDMQNVTSDVLIINVMLYLVDFYYRKSFSIVV